MAIQFATEPSRSHYVEVYRDSGRILTAELLSLIVKTTDGVVFISCGFFAIYIVFGDFPTSVNYACVIILGSSLYAVLLRVFLCYRQDFLLSTTLKLGPCCMAAVCAFALLAMLPAIFEVDDGRFRPWLQAWLLSVAICLGAFRLSVGAALGLLVRDGALALRTVILGAGEHGQRVAARIVDAGPLRVRLLGFVDDRKSRIPQEGAYGAVLGGLDQLHRLIREDSVDQVVIALPWSATERLRTLVAELAVWPIRITLAPDAVDFEPAAPQQGDRAARFSLLCLCDRPMSDWAAIAKRAEDLIVSVLALALLLWPMLLIALAIKLESPGPVLFRQKRYGFKNNLIDIYKFRSMHHHLCDADAAVLTTRQDPRVTRVGSFLRRTSLDELPQLINVLKGDMSIVGPRPHALKAKAAGHLYSEIVPRYASRHRVKPGITGWAQICGWRGETDTVDKIQKRVEHDLLYIENWSLWFDLVILARTALGLFKDPNAY